MSRNPTPPRPHQRWRSFHPAATEPDCDDDDASAHPGATDHPEVRADQDCDGVDATVEDTGDVVVDGHSGDAASPPEGPSPPGRAARQPARHPEVGRGAAP